MFGSVSPYLDGYLASGALRVQAELAKTAEKPKKLQLNQRKGAKVQGRKGFDSWVLHRLGGSF